MKILNNPAVSEMQKMTESEAPKIEFPCDDYLIKVIGEKSEDYYAKVLDVMGLHAPGFDMQKIAVRESRNGNYQSITVYIRASGTDQLAAIFEDLKNISATRMVL